LGRDTDVLLRELGTIRRFEPPRYRYVHFIVDVRYRTNAPLSHRALVRALSVRIAILLAIVSLSAATSWSAHVTLQRGAALDQLFREIQLHRARLGVLQINEETAARGYVVNGDPQLSRTVHRLRERVALGGDRSDERAAAGGRCADRS
jgi:hypothetical protein